MYRKIPKYLFPYSGFSFTEWLCLSWKTPDRMLMVNYLLRSFWNLTLHWIQSFGLWICTELNLLGFDSALNPIFWTLAPNPFNFDSTMNPIFWTLALHWRPSFTVMSKELTALFVVYLGFIQICLFCISKERYFLHLCCGFIGPLTVGQI